MYSGSFLSIPLRYYYIKYVLRSALDIVELAVLSSIFAEFYQSVEESVYRMLDFYNGKYAMLSL